MCFFTFSEKKELNKIQVKKIFYIFRKKEFYEFRYFALPFKQSTAHAFEVPGIEMKLDICKKKKIGKIKVEI
jgi:hypothetical protein